MQIRNCLAAVSDSVQDSFSIGVRLVLEVYILEYNFHYHIIYYTKFC